MKQFMQVFDIELKIKGPLYIGSGQELTKKEYIFDRKNKKVIVPELNKMYSDLQLLGKVEEYENFIMNQPRLELGQWIQQQNKLEKSYSSWKKYELDCGDAVVEKGSRMQIMTFVKDAYNQPYIPGSSLKGMLRTVLLAYDIHCNSQNYKRIRSTIEQNMHNRARRNVYLSREMKQLEQECFHNLDRTEKRQDMVNDIMAGFIVSDSEPLSVDDLTLCQKLEYHTDGTMKRLNLLRECIKPGSVAKFTLSIDKSLCPYTKEYIMKAVEWFSNSAYEYFISKYPKSERPAENSVWLGGGAGYISKTVTYNLFGKDAVDVVCTIFQNTNVPREHKHNRDVMLGVSPHILKLTQYRGKQYQFGHCVITIKEHF